VYGHHELTHPGLAHKEMEIEEWRYRYLIGTKGSEMRHIQNNYKVKVSILRDGKEMDVEVTLAGPSLLVPRGQYDTRPTFTLVGGMLFQNLSLEFLQSWGDLKDAPVHLVEEYYSSPVREDRQEVVVLTQVLQDQVNVGYHWESIGLEVVRKVNDVDVVNLKHFVELVDEAMMSGEGEYLVLHLGKSRVPQRVILEKSALAEADGRIRERYGIPIPRSESLPPTPWLATPSSE
jgi:hypothetical protein